MGGEGYEGVRRQWQLVLVLAAAEAMVSQWSHIHTYPTRLCHSSVGVGSSVGVSSLHVADGTKREEAGGGQPAQRTRGRFFGGDILTRGRRIFWHREAERQERSVGTRGSDEIVEGKRSG